jgi:hypothetical protein
MASLRRFSDSKFWYACFTGPDGRSLQRSTKETDRKRAQKIAGYRECCLGRHSNCLRGCFQRWIGFNVFAVVAIPLQPFAFLLRLIVDNPTGALLVIGFGVHLRTPFAFTRA